LCHLAQETTCLFIFSFVLISNWIDIKITFILSKKKLKLFCLFFHLTASQNSISLEAYAFHNVFIILENANVTQRIEEKILINYWKAFCTFSIENSNISLIFYYSCTRQTFHVCFFSNWMNWKIKNCFFDENLIDWEIIVFISRC